MITLTRWFESDPRGDAPNAFGREGARSAGDLRRDVTGQTARLTHDVLLPGAEVLLRVEREGDRFSFSLADAERPERLFASGRGRLEPRR